MKSRSHHYRLPAMDPTDDWVNGSWTVDCVCGVNFDDGEEMVDCDECGVWVHTRCSRYVKSEKSFACDKCKNRSSGNECEETEVAQLLVELPNKTLRMASNSNNTCPPVGPPRHPFRLWTHRPMEERVHVQGVPGGEPSLFNGLSSIFTPELWKCTGHVPKKFNFKYREFPCWDEDVGNEEENDNPVDKGAGVLFSLSKDVSYTHVANTLLRKKGWVEGGGCERVVALEDSKKCEGGDINVRPWQKDVRKDGALIRSTVFQSGKRKKEDFGASKDQTTKKKVRLVHKDKDSKKIATETSITASTPPSDANILIFYEANGPKIVDTDNQGAKNSDVDAVQSNPFSCDEDVAKNNVEKSSSNLASFEKLHGNNDFDVSNKQSLLTGAGAKEEKGCHQVYTRFKDSLNSDSGVKYFVKNDNRGSTSLKKEADGAGVNDVNDSKRSPKSTEGDPTKSEGFPEKKKSPNLEVVDNEIALEKTLNHKNKVKTGLGVDNVANVESSIECEAKIEETKSPSQHVESSSTKHLDIKTDNMTVTSLRYVKAHGDDTSTDTVGKGQADSPDIKLKMSHNTAHPSKISNKNAVPQALSYHHKVTENRRLSESKSHNSKTGIVESKNNTKKDKDRLEKSNSSIKRDRGNHELPGKILKEHPKSSLGSVLKASESKRILSDSKHSDGGSFSKTLSNKNSGVNSCSFEPVSSLENQNVSHVHSKVSSLGSSLKGEKSNHSNSNSAMHLPASSNSPAILSDEELALLLHQELNSSPRVPRVPRVRQAGSVPQLGSPTGTTTFIKRTSSSGGRDQSAVVKRKDKDSAKTGSHSSENIDDEMKDDFPLSPDRKNNKSLRATDALPKRERDSTRKGSHTVKKNAIPLSPTTRITRPFSPSGASEIKLGSTRHSLRNPSDDDEDDDDDDDDDDDVKGPRHQTLPALLAEIMAEGKRMTYEDLCNSVLPHWPHLRKHNGERYAYSTHSQAVLDCLRNRQEWARLVDRGPKQTNGNRKRRKHDTETQSNDSEEDEYGGKDNSAEEMESGNLKSHQEEFPKGKRKARKRRRLPLQGRRAKDVTSKCKTESDDGDDNGSFSSSSDDSMFSDDDMHGDSTS